MRTGSGRPNITCQNLGCYHAGTWRLNLRCNVSSAISNARKRLPKIRLSAQEPPGRAGAPSNNGAAGVPARPPRRHERARRLLPALGLCARQNCPMLETVADPDGGCASNRSGRFVARKLPLQLSTMRRLTARFLLLVLFAGTLAPWAAAASVPSQHEHCARTPPAVQTQTTPSCHHVAAEAHERSSSGPINENNLHSNPCCTGHECCRPLARALWAQVSLHSPSQQTGRTSDRILAFQPHVRTLEFAIYHSVRAPPAL